MRQVPVSWFKWTFPFKWISVFSLPLLPKFESSEGPPGFALQPSRDVAVLDHELQGAQEHPPPQQGTLAKRAKGEALAGGRAATFWWGGTGMGPAFAGNPPQSAEGPLNRRRRPACKPKLHPRPAKALPPAGDDGIQQGNAASPPPGLVFFQKSTFIW